MRDGADYVVIGRQITRAADPAEEAARILDEIQVGRTPSSARVPLDPLLRTP
jgi:3-keto-L-gulonate-6-phosphate decarboxylase